MDNGVGALSFGVELAGGQKLRAKMVVLADGVHSKTAKKYHKMPLKIMEIAGWRCVGSHLLCAA